VWGVGGVDVERGRGLGGFEGRRTGSSMSPPRRRRDREEDGGVGRDVRATQQELAPVPRCAGTWHEPTFVAESDRKGETEAHPQREIIAF